jgi:hypothetical protein
MPISRPEKKMKAALKEAGHTIAEYVDPAPGDDRDPEETLDELIGEIDNDDVGQALAESDRAEGKPTDDTSAHDKAALARELRADPKAESFADLVNEDRKDEAAGGNAKSPPPIGKTGS